MATRRRSRKTRAFLGEGLETRAVLDSTVTFNELMYHSPVDGPGEFIELYNQMGIDFEISAWKVTGGVEYQFAEGTVVPAGGYLVLAQDPTTFQARTGRTALGPWVGRLNNGREELELLDRNQRQMDVMAYDNDAPWPLAPDGSGASLAKRNRDTRSEIPENWTSSIVVGGTPGAANFADQVANIPQDVVQTLVDWNDSWHYDDQGIDRGSNWTTVTGNDPWPQAAGVFYAGAARRLNATPTVVTNVQATATSELSGYTVDQIVNGSGLRANGAHTPLNAVDTMWQSNGTFFGLPPDTNPEVTFDLGRNLLLNEMRVWNFNQVDTPTCCLNRGVREADILVAGDDRQFQRVIENQNFAQAPGTDTDFSQRITFSDVTARYVKLDIENVPVVANHGDPFQFVGLSEVQFTAYPPAGDTRVTLGPQTHYFRRSFDFQEDPLRTSLQLSLLIDDGSVVYLNGQEIHRQAMPAGETRYETRATLTTVHVGTPTVVQIPASALRRGANMLAVEVHQAELNDPDMVFGMQVLATTRAADLFLPEDLDVLINEVAAADAADFFVELYNSTSQVVDIGGHELVLSDGVSHVFPAGTQIPAGNFFVWRDPLPGVTHAAGTVVGLYSPGRQQVWDVTLVDRLTRGRSPDGAAMRWAVSQATPGVRNQVQVSTEIAINEIMYHHRPEAARPATPPQFDRTAIVALNAPWRYNESGEALPKGWATAAHPVGGNWQSGAGLLGFETNPVVSPGLGTTLTDPLVKGIITYYFETEFTLTEQELAAATEVQLRHVIDDGAVFYLNGEELLRVNMPTTDFDHTTIATANVNNAIASDPISILKSRLRVGVNRLSAELHQRSASSNDILFGADLVLARQVDDGIPATPYTENDEEWIELYNRSNRTVDLSGWRLDRAVDYVFPAGTLMPPDSYLVVARDAAALVAKYPALSGRIVGDFAGSLSNTSDWIQLFDARGNLADEVHYYENGQWAAAADGGGSSLELRDPLANNALGLAWAASDEAAKSTWQTITYRGVVQRSAVGPDGRWQEFLFGMLDQGQVLLDDIRVTLEPNGAATPLIQNGTFEGDTLGENPATWRAIGNHRHSPVVVDPDNPNNKAWLFTATGPTEHMHNHAETTLKNNGIVSAIQNGVEYEISYRAKWISGSNQLNSRLYFNRLARTTPIGQPALHGTPGRVNSTRVANLGPTYEGLRHSPVVPDPNETVTVSVEAADNDGMGSVTLWYSVAAGAWNSTPMSFVDRRYVGFIPGQSAASIVQFYVEATDRVGATSTFPREGRASRALYKVQDGAASKTGLFNLRLVVEPNDAKFLHSEVELMSNDPIPATVIYNESEVFYDATVMLSGSQRARPFQPRLGFSVGFASDHLFRDVHSSLTLDRSESTGYGQREIIYDYGGNHAGGVPTKYNDLFHIITPLASHTGPAQIELARYSDVFLDEQYERGSDGQVYEYELIYFPTSTVGNNPEGRKRPQPDEVVGTAIRFLTEIEEDYRFVMINKNNRLEDDYSDLIDFMKVMSLNATEFLAQAETVIDVDQWLRAFAIGAMTGHGDNWLTDGSQHNLQLYVRPTDRRVLLFPHDMDAFFDPNRAVVGNDDLRRLIRNPNYGHAYYGYLNDMIETTFNANYFQRWTTYWGSLMPGQNFTGHLNDIVRRSNSINTQITRAAPRVAFGVTAAPAEVAEPTARVTGNGWVNVREIRLAGSPVALPIRWTALTQWEVDLPLVQGANALTLEAYDFQGKLLASAPVQIVSTAPNVLVGNLRLTEIHYHPADPTAEELEQHPGIGANDLEFVEVANAGAQALQLLGVRLADGIEYAFPSTILQPGEAGVVVAEEAAFRLRYGAGPRILGVFQGNLNNAGEGLQLLTATGGVLAQVSYTDAAPWSPSADGDGFSLSLKNPLSPLAPDPALAANWHASSRSGGTPGSLRDARDVNADGLSDVNDLDDVARWVFRGDPRGDLNRDGAANSDDLDHLVHEVFQTHAGDVNLDGLFNSTDLVRLFQLGEYEDAIVGNSVWSDGDFDGSGDFTTRDLVVAFQEGAYVQGAEVAARMANGVLAAANVAEVLPDDLRRAAAGTTTTATGALRNRRPADDTYTAPSTIAHNADLRHLSPIVDIEWLTHDELHSRRSTRARRLAVEQSSSPMDETLDLAWNDWSDDEIA